MIQIISEEEYLSLHPINKFSMLRKDIFQIIDERIKYCELTNLQYSIKSGITDIASRARHIVAEKFYNLTGKRLGREVNLLILSKVVDENKKPHLYCAFDFKEWDRLVANAKD